MAKPAILTIDDDPQVLRAVERDLRQKYARDYRVVRAESGAVALDALERLKMRNDPVALLVADQRMPQMTGVEFLERAKELYPDAKRVLLTAYADTDAAISAINDVRIHYYLMKPWDPPEQNLYPYLDDLLEDWQAGYYPPFEGLRLVGYRWAPHSHALRDFRGRNLIPFQWLDVDESPAAKSLLALAETEEAKRVRLPLAVFADGSTLEDPDVQAIAERVGLRTHAERAFYDLAVVGGGPAGLAAAVYGASEGLKTVLVEREAPGGQAGTSARIENYLGFPAGLSGADLTRRAVAQARRFGAEIVTPQDVSGIRVENDYRIVTLESGGEIAAKAVLVATGVSWRVLDAPGAAELTGAGIYYGAAMTEALSCRGEHVYVVGGGNSAGQAALHFSGYADRVTIVVRGEGLEATMSQYLVDQIAQTPNVELVTKTCVTAASGGERLETITLASLDGSNPRTVETHLLFIFIGAVPRTDWLDGTIERDARGFVVTGPELVRDGRRPKGWRVDRDPYLLETSVPGVFAAGDVRHQSIKRVASAVGEGSIAVQFVHQYLSNVG
jgi:thioredoxin reductase (NADPH)